MSEFRRRQRQLIRLVIVGAVFLLFGKRLAQFFLWLIIWQVLHGGERAELARLFGLFLSRFVTLDATALRTCPWAASLVEVARIYHTAKIVIVMQVDRLEELTVLRVFIIRRL